MPTARETQPHKEEWKAVGTSGVAAYSISARGIRNLGYLALTRSSKNLHPTGLQTELPKAAVMKTRQPCAIQMASAGRHLCFGSVSKCSVAELTTPLKTTVVIEPYNLQTGKLSAEEF